MAIKSVNSASKTHEQGSPRRLFEILKEKQEPFVLEIYLLERKCIRNGMQNHKPSSSNHGTSSLERFSSITKCLYRKIGLANEVLKRRQRSKKKKGMRNDDKDVMEASRCSTASFCSSLSKTWCESDTDGDSITSPAANYKTTHEPIRDRTTCQWRFGEENKQFSPSSVLEEIDLLKSIPAYNFARNEEEAPTRKKRALKKVSEDSILSASLWEMFEQARKENPQRLGSKSFSMYMNSMKALQQTRQLLFDSVRDVVETRNTSKQQRIISREKGLMGAEEISNIMCKNLKTWGKHYGNNTSSKNLLRMDLVNSDEEQWGSFGGLNRDIVIEIENGIFAEITDEMIKDMVD